MTDWNMKAALEGMKPGEDLDAAAPTICEMVEQFLQHLYRGAPREFRKPDFVIILARDGEVGCGTTVESVAAVGFALGKMAKKLDDGKYRVVSPFPLKRGPSA